MIAAIFFSAASVAAQYTNDPQDEVSAAPPGMEERKVNNDVTVLMPRGSKMYERNKSTFVEESADEYSARKFLDIDNRFKKLEAENRDLAEQVKYLKSKLILQDKGADKDAPNTSEE
jgi:hypothetical protein